MLSTTFFTKIADRKLIFHTSFALFNVLRWMIDVLLCSWVVWRIPTSIEWYRRAYYLRHKKKVRIGGPDWLLFRAAGISSSPWAIGLSIVCFLILFFVQLMVSSGTGATFVATPRSRMVSSRAIGPYSVDVWSKEFRALKKHFYPCSAYNRDFITI